MRSTVHRNTDRVGESTRITAPMFLFWKYLSRCLAYINYLHNFFLPCFIFTLSPSSNSLRNDHYLSLNTNLVQSVIKNRSKVFFVTNVVHFRFQAKYQNVTHNSVVNYLRLKQYCKGYPTNNTSSQLIVYRFTMEMTVT